MLANIALLSWPALALIIFAIQPVVRALVVASILPYLFLPERWSINLPLLPDIDKTASISLGLICGLLLKANIEKRRVAASARLHGSTSDKTHYVEKLSPLRLAAPHIRFLSLLLPTLVVIGLVVTVINNSERLYFGGTVVPAARPWDVVGWLGEFTLFSLPFFLAWRYMPHPEAHRLFLKALVVGALVYSLLMLVEIRLSPQLHNWVYGYHQHSFLQHVRDGFRPKVFLQHGIWVGFFIFMSLVASVGLWKAERKVKWLVAAGWLFVILMISENMAAFVLGVLFAGAFFVLWTRAQIWLITAVALSILTYPALRQAHLVPIDRIVELAAMVSEERAASLQFRLENEDQLLARAGQKPLTGWGGWNREKIFDNAGNMVSVSEGRWIQTLGRNGWIGYIGWFGTLTLPLLTLRRTLWRKPIPPETMALALICAGNLIYMIPNSTLTVLSWLAFGALMGFAQYDAASQNDAASQSSWSKRVPRYTRFNTDGHAGAVMRTKSSTTTYRPVRKS